MIKVITKMLFLIFISMITGCNEKMTETQIPNCKAIIVNNEVFSSYTKETEFKMIEYDISENCLEIMFEYGGCNEAEIVLIASEDIAESFPPQRDIRFSFDKNGECEMLIRSVGRFNIEDLSTDGNSIILNIKELDFSIEYIY